MPVELIRPASLTDSAPYAYAARVAGHDLVFSAGACPLDADGKIGPVGDRVGQAARVMDNLRTALAATGAGLQDVAKSTVYVVTEDRADLVAVWDVVREALAGHDAPSTLLAVSLLGYPDQLVEVEAVAAVPPRD